MPLLPVVDLPRLTGQMLYDVVRGKGATAGGLDGWGWKELKVLPVSWFDQLARILTLVEDHGYGRMGFWMLTLPMIPKTDGDATPSGAEASWCVACCLSYLGFFSYGSA